MSVVFYESAAVTNMHTHAHHHGSWSDHGGTTQYFWQHGCWPMDAQHASGSVTSNRYHMRHIWAYDPAEPWLGSYSIATPHYETIDLNCNWWLDPNHKVTNGYPGGFVMGKWEIGYRWHNWNGVYGGSPGQHLWLESQYWDNRDAIPQCEGAAANDGWVDFVRIVGSGH